MTVDYSLSTLVGQLESLFSVFRTPMNLLISGMVLISAVRIFKYIFDSFYIDQDRTDSAIEENAYADFYNEDDGDEEDDWDDGDEEDDENEPSDLSKPFTRCPNCNLRIFDHDRYCPGCGAPC
jgi:hypothetical protein